MSRYLYGAAIQGIQKYIFQTQKLKDIIGASELVKQLCDTVFENEFTKKAKGKTELIVHAAGNVKCIFDNKEDCERAVRLYPKRVMEKAPGVTISQAVVEMEGDYNHKDVEKLEGRLHAQRNRVYKSLTMGYLATERSRTTGLPAIPNKNNEFIDEGTLAKQEALHDYDVNRTLMKDLVGKEVKYEDIGLNTSDLTGQNDWIAIIHADGNGLGEVVAAIGKNEKGSALAEFSHNLDVATIASANTAYQSIAEKNTKVKPIRPIVIGGDDLTVICRGDLAIPFVRAYLEAFEKESYEKTGHKLTACAGIAFVKSSYPFSFGYELAEALCGEAKKDAKSDAMRTKDELKLAPSCLMFHKVQSSFVEDYNTIKKKELTPQKGHSLCFGPYYLKPEYIDPKERWTIDTLMDNAELLSKEDNNSIKTSTRKWLSLMHEGTEVAKQHSERVHSLASTAQWSLYSSLTKGEERAEEGKKDKLYPAYDVLALHTIMNQKTKD